MNGKTDNGIMGDEAQGDEPRGLTGEACIGYPPRGRRRDIGEI